MLFRPTVPMLKIKKTKIGWKIKKLLGVKRYLCSKPLYTKPFTQKIRLRKVEVVVGGGGGRGLKLPVLCDKMVASQGSAQS